MPRPTTGYDMAPEALALAQEIQRWKARTGRAFPTWSEVAGILLGLGWRPPELAPPPSPTKP